MTWKPIGRLHDSNLTCIRTDSIAKTVALDFIRTDKSACRVDFGGVSLFRCDCFLQGNIVSYLAEIVPADLGKWLKHMFAEYNPGHEWIGKKLEAGELRCFELMGSYGADIGCLALSYQVTELSKGAPQ